MTQDARPAERPGSGSPVRLEALIDGAFAIVMTIIVLEIEPPPGPPAEFGRQLAELLPTLATYGLVFVTLGTLWFGNRTQSGFVRTTDHPLTWINLAIVGLVALVPFTARFLIEFPGERLAVVLFGAHLAAVYLVHGSAWLYASRHPALLRPGIAEEFRRRSRIVTYIPAGIYLVAIGLGALSPIAGLIGYLAVPALLASGLFYRGLARIHDASSTG